MSTRFRQDIQGLRAIAVLAVVFGHAFPDVFTGGYVGVDIFFVISGFLISGIIIREIEEERFSILIFYRRRIRRIFPALTVVTLCTLIAGYYFLSPTAYREEARNVVSTMLFVSNFDFWNLTGYFDGAAQLKPLLNMWSLAVEEQFYIFFPPLLISIWPRFGRRKSLVAITVLTISSIAVAEILRARSGPAAYFLLPARGFELLMGTLLAARTFPSILEPKACSVISLSGLACTLFSILFYSSTTPFPGFTALLPCLGAALIIYTGQATVSTPVSRFLSIKPICFVGDISYSLYLWHWPILAYIRNLYTIELNFTQATAGIFASMLVATLSYKLIEQPFLRERLRRLPYLMIALADIAAFSFVGILFYSLHGLPWRFSPQAQILFAASEDYNHRREDCHYSGIGKPKPYNENCTFGIDGVKPDIAVWGDSHGAELVVALGDRAKAAGRSVMEITSSACPPAMDYSVPDRKTCVERNRISLEGLVSDPNINTVVLTTNAYRYPDETKLEVGLNGSISALKAAQKQVILVKQIPVMPLNAAGMAGLYLDHNQDLSSIGVSSAKFYAESKRYNDFVDSMEKGSNVIAFNPASKLCDDLICHAYLQNVGVLYFNEDHLSIKGASVVFSPLADEIYRAR